MVKSPTNKKARIKMGDLWSRVQLIRRQRRIWETFRHKPNQKEGKEEYGRLVVKSPTNKKARMTMGDLWSRAQPIRMQG